MVVTKNYGEKAFNNEELGYIYLKSAEKLEPMAEKLRTQIDALKEKGGKNIEVDKCLEQLSEVRKMIRDAKIIGNYLINYETREELRF